MSDFAWHGSLRAAGAMRKRGSRLERLALKELQRREKEAARTSALESARLEVASHLAEIDLLLSVHKEVTEPFDWQGLSSSLPPPPPARQRKHELLAREEEAVARAGITEFSLGVRSRAPADAIDLDDQEFEAQKHSHQQEMDSWRAQRSIASRVLAGDTEAYREALEQLNPFEDTPDVDAKLAFTVHSRRIVECLLTVRGTEVIPSEVKSLSASGKVQVKAMPKSRFVEVFQDYVCSCVIRTAREAFGLTAFEWAIVTARIAEPGQVVGTPREIPVVSVLFPKRAFELLPFGTLDPSDTIESFAHRGDVKASRKTGEFVPITPLTLADVPQESTATAKLSEALVIARRLREELAGVARRSAQPAEAIPT